MEALATPPAEPVPPPVTASPPATRGAAVVQQAVEVPVAEHAPAPEADARPEVTPKPAAVAPAETTSPPRAQPEAPAPAKAPTDVEPAEALPGEERAAGTVEEHAADAPPAAAAPATAPAPSSPQPRRPPPPPPGGRRVAVITGGTSGIGLATAQKLLRRNDFDVIIGANEASGPEAADTAVATIKAAVPYLDEPDAPRVLVLPLDLARPTSVKDFATRVMAITPGVHWLFLNAAVGDVASPMWGSKPVLNAEGHERTVAVNYFGHYLLCRHLLKALTYAAPSRVVSVSCSRHMHAWRLDHTNWQLLNPAPWWQPVHFKAGDAYNNSKVRRRVLRGSSCSLSHRHPLFVQVMTIAHAFKFSRTYAVANGVSANAVDPGIVPGTGLLREQSPLFRAGFEHVTAPTWSVAMRVVTPDQAANALIAAAEHPKSSAYFVGTREGSPSSQTRDEVLQAHLWADTATLLGVEWPVPGTDL